MPIPTNLTAVGAVYCPAAVRATECLLTVAHGVRQPPSGSLLRFDLPCTFGTVREVSRVDDGSGGDWRWRRSDQKPTVPRPPVVHVVPGPAGWHSGRRRRCGRVTERWRQATGIYRCRTPAGGRHGGCPIRGQGIVCWRALGTRTCSSRSVQMARARRARNAMRARHMGWLTIRDCGHGVRDFAAAGGRAEPGVPRARRPRA